MNADIIIAMGLETLSEAEKVAIIDEMTETVQLGVAKRVMDQLDEAKQQELSSVMEKDDSEALNQFLDANVPDFETLIEQEMVAFKRAMLTGNTSPQA
jgi:Mg/Co/Ni transporter MgtE